MKWKEACEGICSYFLVDFGNFLARPHITKWAKNGDGRTLIKSLSRQLCRLFASRVLETRPVLRISFFFYSDSFDNIKKKKTVRVRRVNVKCVHVLSGISCSKFFKRMILRSVYTRVIEWNFFFFQIFTTVRSPHLHTPSMPLIRDDTLWLSFNKALMKRS